MICLNSVSRVGIAVMRPISRPASSPVKFTTTPIHRPISWMAFEAPSQTLYANHLRKYHEQFEAPSQTLYQYHLRKYREDQAAIALKSETHENIQNTASEAAITASGTKDRQEDAGAHSTTPSDKQDSTKGVKTKPRTDPDSTFLSTTLIQIQGCPATWPCEEEEKD